MSRILITGGSGFIGTNIIFYLATLNDVELLNIDIVAPKIEEQNVFWKNIDICDTEQLGAVIAQFVPDYVIHLAARTDLNGKTLQDYSANTIGVRSLLEVLDKIPNLKRVIFASSMYVCYPGYSPKSFEDYAPHTVYGESKVETEKIIKTDNPTNYTWSIIRPTSIWGPYFGEPYDKFFRIVLSRSYFHLGKKACKKTYGYIDNTISQIMSILNADESIVNKQVYYLGDYEPYDITEWANEIAAEIGIKIPTIPYFLFVLAGWFGDFMKMLKIKFPMTSFRLKNMTTDNIHDLAPIKEIAPDLPIDRTKGNRKTIEWIQHK